MVHTSEQGLIASTVTVRMNVSINQHLFIHEGIKMILTVLLPSSNAFSNLSMECQTPFRNRHS